MKFCENLDRKERFRENIYKVLGEFLVKFVQI